MFQFPLNTINVTSRFIIYSPLGYSQMHYGMDFGCSSGTPCYAANDGKVVGSFYDSAGGNMIIIQGQNELSRYAHLKSRGVVVGQTVERGELIGYTGNTGSATTGAHLHFETWITPDSYVYNYNDRTRYAVDPMSVCHLLSNQKFYSSLDVEDPIPYPEPDIETTAVTGTMTVTDGRVRFRTIPETEDYQYVVGGYDRSKTVFSSFFKNGTYPIIAICKNGYDWALVDTGMGYFWVSEYAGRTKINVEIPPEPQPDLYKVEVEDTMSKEEAEKLVKQLSTAGYTAVYKKI